MGFATQKQFCAFAHINLWFSFELNAKTASSTMMVIYVSFSFGTWIFPPPCAILRGIRAFISKRSCTHCKTVPTVQDHRRLAWIKGISRWRTVLVNYFSVDIYRFLFSYKWNRVLAAAVIMVVAQRNVDSIALSDDPDNGCGRHLSHVILGPPVSV